MFSFPLSEQKVGGISVVLIELKVSLLKNFLKIFIHWKCSFAVA